MTLKCYCPDRNHSHHSGLPSLCEMHVFMGVPMYKCIGCTRNWQCDAAGLNYYFGIAPATITDYADGRIENMQFSYGRPMGVHIDPVKEEKKEIDYLAINREFSMR